MKKFSISLLTGIMLLTLVSCGGQTAESFKWEDMVLHDILPKPHATRGEIHTNSDSELWIDIAKTSEAQYNSYVSTCIEFGFTVDSESSSISYEAFNDAGYKINLTYYSTMKELSIKVDAPMEMGQLRWPNSDIAKLLPVPKSSVGRFEWEKPTGFVLYVANTSLDDFNNYADACAENGFTADCSQGERHYYADNVDGYHVSLRYEGYNVMFVRIDGPDEINNPQAPEQAEGPEESDVPSPSPAPTASSALSPSPSPTPTASNTPEPSQSTSRTVYITRTGKKYHYSSTCNGGTYYPSTLQEALSRGLTPCGKCVN